MYSIFEGFELIIIWIYTGSFMDPLLNKMIFLNILKFIDILKINLLGLLIIIYFFSVRITPFISFVPNLLQSFLEIFYKFILNIINEQAGAYRKNTQTIIYSTNFLGPILVLGITILFFNLLGLFPYGFALTGLFAVTLSFSTIFFIAWIIVGIAVLRFSILYLFFPAGISIYMQPLMFTIEFISFFMRPLSLAIRLFANILAGHVLLSIIANGALVVLDKLSKAYYSPIIELENPSILLDIISVFIHSIMLGSILIIVMLIFAFFVTLEIGVAFLQTYVFITLVAIYLKDSLHAHRTIAKPTEIQKIFFRGTSH
jgi:F-type H+-transporting ATPase subunit a